LVQLNWLQVFTASAYGASLIGMIFMALSAVYFFAQDSAGQRYPTGASLDATLEFDGRTPVLGTHETRFH